MTVVFNPRDRACSRYLWLAIVLVAVCARKSTGQISAAASAAGQVSALDGLNAPADGDVDTKTLHAGMLKFANQIRVYTDLQETKQAKLQEKPIFRWSNPERSAVAGNLFLWTENGRPLATLGTWCFRGKPAGFEMQSMGEKQFSVITPDRTWRPNQAAIRFVELDKEKPPAKTPLRRLNQMRLLLSKRFRATATSGRGNVETLRLLPKPIFRYDEKPTGVIDGAVFSFASGTDPEVLVIVEARGTGKTINGKPARSRWHYAFAPSTFIKVDGFVDRKLVWTRHNMNNTDRTYLRGF